MIGNYNTSLPPLENGRQQIKQTKRKLNPAALAGGGDNQRVMSVIARHIKINRNVCQCR